MDFLDEILEGRKRPQERIYNSIANRCYVDGLEPEQFLARQGAKLIEELNEVLHELRLPVRLQTDSHLVALEARELFDDKEVWGKYGVENMDRLKKELSDCMVVLLGMAHTIELHEREYFDLVGWAVNKARADESRGVRKKSK